MILKIENLRVTETIEKIILVIVSYHKQCIGRIWGQEEYDIVNGCKENAIESHKTHHHGSCKNHYEFDNKASFAIIDNYSVEKTLKDHL